ncbi:DUF4190 domain-containing protein [Paenibacillus sp. LHD-117]|uniref:DUF4190 domain-containing protein n=1 Tax=Paenibacillus sp. LHD-117 TaxID=3071412 RepID=UPI0027DED3BC|nr:DUF4190 domain-containing protein [Paenibacillus sp. LHD-117]MDQ6421096.1 DUF4190 domain-containing protein [Paenibacillus sp. LHD-117]
MDDQVKRDDDIYNNHELKTGSDAPAFAPTNVGTPTNLPNAGAFNEEMGADFAYGMPAAADHRPASGMAAMDADTESSGTALGWVALVFAIASWFIWPVLIGATAAVLGFIAYRRGARGLGGWAMGIGLVALALNLIIVPFYYALT